MWKLLQNSWKCLPQFWENICEHVEDIFWKNLRIFVSWEKNLNSLIALDSIIVPVLRIIFGHWICLDIDPAQWLPVVRIAPHVNTHVLLHVIWCPWYRRGSVCLLTLPDYLDVKITFRNCRTSFVVGAMLYCRYIQLIFLQTRSKFCLFKNLYRDVDGLLFTFSPQFPSKLHTCTGTIIVHLPTRI